jgi:hypothetical protein
MKHVYEITVSNRAPKAEGASAPDLRFGFESHDDLSEIAARVRDKGLFASEDETQAFCLGLKLLGGALIAHRDQDLFKDFAGSFGVFMKKLKASR